MSANPKQTMSDEGMEDSTARTYDLSKPADVFTLAREADESVIKKVVAEHVASIISRHSLDQYATILLLDEVDSLSTYHANQVYEAASAAGRNSDIFLILQNGGGRIEPAYLISKTCKRLSKSKFVVAVPRRAKSAATLIALGADEIHMGLMSELGPIDPQIRGYPALGLANALNKLADLACKFPASANMWAEYLAKNLSLNDLGYFERISESAAQYAERLLAGKKLKKPHTAQSLANHFVNHYKDHSFVIDFDEADSLLGSDVIKADTPEYRCANDIYQFFSYLAFVMSVFRKKKIYYVGAPSTGPSMSDES